MGKVPQGATSRTTGIEEKGPLHRSGMTTSLLVSTPRGLNPSRLRWRTHLEYEVPKGQAPL